VFATPFTSHSLVTCKPPLALTPTISRKDPCWGRFSRIIPESLRVKSVIWPTSKSR